MDITQNDLIEFGVGLKYNKFKNKLVDIIFVHCTDDDGDFIRLQFILIKKSQRHKGIGSAVMYEICNYADKHNVRIKLTPTDMFGAEIRRLTAFFRKHNFFLIEKENKEMVYNPKKIK